MELYFKVDEDMQDKLISNVMVMDYKHLLNDIKNLENSDDLKDFEKEDLENNRRYANALKGALEYYLPHNEYKNLIKDDV